MQDLIASSHLELSLRHACRSFCIFLGVSAFAAVLIGCNLSQFSAPSTASSVLPAISGNVHGGQQPISGATIQIYAANTSVSKGASTALLSSPVLTNANGGFSIGAGAYTCPTPGTLVYLTAYGGNPGLPGNVNNTAIGLMVVLGTCSSLSTDAFVTVNELTTVAAVEALAPFMADAAHVGSDAGNPGGLAGAFATAASMVNFATGQIQTAPAGVTQPVALLNTLADILAACVNSAGRSLNHSAPCEVLRGYAGLGGAPDTLTAILLIVRYPSQNVPQLFGLVGAAVPFAPTLTLAPADFSASSFVVVDPTTYADGLTQVVVDKAQHVWVLDNYLLSVFDNSLNRIRSIQLGSLDPNGIFATDDMAADPFGNVWVIAETTYGYALFEFGSEGQLLSPPGGINVDSYGVGSNLTIDKVGNIWMTGSSAKSTNCFVEYSNAGKPVSPLPGFCTNPPLACTQSLEADEAGDVWSYCTLSQKIFGVDPAGISLTPINGNPVGITNSQSGPIAFDASRKRFWVSDAPNQLMHNVNVDGTENFAAVLTFETAQAGDGTVDDNGTLWAASGASGIGGMDANGNILTPFDSSRSPYFWGYHPSSTYSSVGLAIDVVGNIFTVDAYTYRLIKLSGVAGPKSKL